MQSQNHTAIIGSQTHLKGSVTGTESLTIAGRLEGSIRLGDSLVVESSAVVTANIQAKSVVIHGTVVGDIQADEFVQLTAQARVVGDLTTPRLVLAEGAAYKGAVNMGGAAAGKASSTPAAARGSKPAAKGAAGSATASAATRAKTATRGRAATRRTKAPKPPTTAGKKSRVRRK